MLDPTEKPKPCPFCGESENVYIAMEDGIYFVKCEECGGRGGDAYRPDNALSMWNMRDPIVARRTIVDSVMQRVIEARQS